MFDTQKDYQLYRLFHGITSWGTSAHHYTSHPCLSSMFCEGEFSLFKKRWREVLWAAQNFKEPHLSPFLCWRALAGVTQDFSAKYLCIVSLAPCKGRCLQLPDILGRTECRERKRIYFLTSFFFFFLILKWAWQLCKSPLGKQPISWKIALSASSFF